MAKTSADRQKAYRDRKRNARNAPPAKIRPAKSGKSRDYWKDGNEFIYIGNFGLGDVYAKVLNAK